MNIYIQIDSIIDGISVYNARYQMGFLLGERIKKLNLHDIDMIVPVPESSIIFALGLLPYIAWIVPKELALDITKAGTGVLAGCVVVLTNLVAGVGGPLLDVFFQRVDMTRHQVVATKAVAQTIGHISKIIFFGGLLTYSLKNWPEPIFLLFAIFLSVVGTTLGKKVLDIIDDEIFFRWTQRIVLSVGAVFIGRGIFLLSQ